jgi:hypothetical protein
MIAWQTRSRRPIVCSGGLRSASSDDQIQVISRGDDDKLCGWHLPHERRRRGGARVADPA